MFVVGAMCSPVYCLPPPILLTNHCFSCSTCGIWVLAFISPVNPWQNGSANMRTQQRKRKTPAIISSPLYQCILQFEALSSCRQQVNDVRKFAMEFSGVAEGLGYMKRPSRMSSTVPLMNPSAAGGWGGRTTWRIGNSRSFWQVPQLRWLVCLRWWATNLQRPKWRQMKPQCP